MKSFTKPQNLDGFKLVEELEAANVIVKPNGLNVKCPLVDGQGLLWLDIAAKDEALAKSIIEVHGQ